MTASLRRLDFGLVSRDWSSFCVHNNAMYAAVYSGLIYKEAVLLLVSLRTCQAAFSH